MNIIWCTEKRYKTMLDPAFFQIEILQKVLRKNGFTTIMSTSKTPKPCLMNFFKKPVIMITIMMMKMKMNSSRSMTN